MSKASKIEEVKRLLNTEAKPQCYYRVYAVCGETKVLLSETPTDTERDINIDVNYPTVDAIYKRLKSKQNESKTHKGAKTESPQVDQD